MRIILMGPPGSGKGTQATILADKLSVPHISTGDIFRAELGKGTPLGLKAKSYMEAGELVPDKIVTGMAGKRINKEDCAEGYILDGFPRTIPQAEGLGKILAENGTSIDLVLEITVDKDIITKRLTGRMGCEQCKQDFNRFFNPPHKEGVCDACGARLVSRADDNEETIQNRLKVYQQETAPLIEYYADKIITIDGNGTPDDVLKRVLKKIDL